MTTPAGAAATASSRSEVRGLWSEAFGAVLRRSSSGIRDTSLGLIPQVAGTLSGLLTAILAARGLGAANLGTYTLAASITATVVGLSDLGIGQTAVRFAARAAAEGRRDEQLAFLRWAFRLRLALSLVLAGGFCLFAGWIGETVWRSRDLAPLIRIAVIPGVLNSLAATAGYYYQSENRFKASSVLATTQTVIILVAVAALALSQRWSPASLLVCTAVSAGLCSWIAVRVMPSEALYARAEGWAWKPWASRLRAGRTTVDAPRGFAALMALSAGIVVVTARVDVWLLGMLLPKESVGIYSVASRFPLPLMMFLGALNAALWPRAARHSGADSAAFLRRTLRLTSLAAVPAVAYSFLAPLLIPVVFGAAYTAAISVSILLCLRFALAIAITPLGIVGYNYGLVRLYWVANLLQLMVVVAVQLLSVPRLGPLGAALSLCANEVVGGMVTWRLLRRSIAQSTAPAP